MSTPVTRGRAIRAMCKDCMHDPASPGTWVQQVDACTSQECPLYAFRPLAKASRPRDAKEPSTRCARIENSNSLATGSDASAERTP
jgi:hypothetical protein